MFDKKLWYKQNRERILKEHKTKYNLNKSDILKKAKIYYQKRRKKILESKKEQDEKLKVKLRELVGFKCVICESEINLLFHEIHGKPHKPRKYILEHYQDFIPLCRNCHQCLHSFANKQKLNPKILEFLKCLSLQK